MPWRFGRGWLSDVLAQFALEFLELLRRDGLGRLIYFASSALGRTQHATSKRVDAKKGLK